MHTESLTVNPSLYLKYMALIMMLFLQRSFPATGQTECKVLMTDISGSYQGGCRKGLAHGNGIAQGVDRYEGEFIKGLPDGKGIYKWANGVIYEGEWKKGIKEGKGKMVYPDSVLTGIWKENIYMGKEVLPPYRIIRSMSVSRSSVIKAPGVSNEIRIRLMQGGIANISVQNFTIDFDSGSEYKNGTIYGLQNFRVPVNVKVKYVTWNQLMTSQSDVVFEFVINEAGTWDVVINN